MNRSLRVNTYVYFNEQLLAQVKDILFEMNLSTRLTLEVKNDSIYFTLIQLILVKDTMDL